MPVTWFEQSGDSARALGPKAHQPVTRARGFGWSGGADIHRRAPFLSMPTTGRARTRGVMKQRWLEAGGEHQVPFILAARKTSLGVPTECQSALGLRSAAIFIE